MAKNPSLANKFLANISGKFSHSINNFLRVGVSNRPEPHVEQNFPSCDCLYTSLSSLKITHFEQLLMTEKSNWLLRIYTHLLSCYLSTRFILFVRPRCEYGQMIALVYHLYYPRCQNFSPRKPI